MNLAIIGQGIPIIVCILGYNNMQRHFWRPRFSFKIILHNNSYLNFMCLSTFPCMTQQNSETHN